MCAHLKRKQGKKKHEKKGETNIYQVAIMCQKESQVFYYSKLFSQLSYEVHSPTYMEEAQKFICSPKTNTSGR